MNKKNRYRSWVYHRVMQQPHPPQHVAAGPECSSRSRHHRGFHNHRQPAAAESPMLQQNHHSDRMDDASYVGSLIQTYVEDILCSLKWRKSMDVEEQKARAKKRSLALKELKEGAAEAIAPSFSLQGHNVRQARSNAPLEERQAVCNWCVDAIHWHICLVYSMCKGVVTDAKLRTTVVGLLYMMRQVSVYAVLKMLSCTTVVRLLYMMRQVSLQPVMIYAFLLRF